MPDTFLYDVFLSHSSKDKPVVRELAEHLKADGVRVWFDEWQILPGDSIPAKIEEGLENSRVLVLCMSKNAFASEWAQLESYTFRFRDPLNKQRRFVPLRLDDAEIKGSLAQFLYLDWRAEGRERAYLKLIEACDLVVEPTVMDDVNGQSATRIVQCGGAGKKIWSYGFSSDGRRALSGDAVGRDGYTAVRLWDLDSGQCLRVFEGHKSDIWGVAFSPDGRRALSGGGGGRDGDTAVRLWDLDSGQCLRVFEGHKSGVYSVAFSPDGRRALSDDGVGGRDGDTAVRLWDLDSGQCLRVFEGHKDNVWDVAFSPDGRRALSGGGGGGRDGDTAVRLWDLDSGQCLRVFEGHKRDVYSVAFSPDGRRALSGSGDTAVRLWDLDSGQCLRVFEGHKSGVYSVAFSPDGRRALSGGVGVGGVSVVDTAVRLWDLDSGQCLRVFEGHKGNVQGVAFSPDGQRAISGDHEGDIRFWDLSEFSSQRGVLEAVVPEQEQYTNAKILVVGDTNAGKTGLTYRLATGDWKPSEDSTVGAWATQYKLPVELSDGVKRELWLWDFGGQADQRLVHQLYMDNSALILLLFNADKEEVIGGLRDWQMALKRCFKQLPQIPCFMVAGRIDTGFKASRGKLQAFAAEEGLELHETSAKTGEGCDGLRDAMIAAIPWDQMAKRTSPRIFKLIKDEILKLRDEGEVLLTFKELREVLWRRLGHEERFDDAVLKTVVGLLDGPGVVKELGYGTYILLAPEWVNAYAQAVIRTLRSAVNDLGCLPLRTIAEGKLIYQSIGRDGVQVEQKRLPAYEERVILGEMERQLEDRGLCLRQGDKLVFPSHCGRDRPVQLEHPSVFVSYAVTGFLDDIYATLVVKLADTEAFDLKDLWRDAADFATLAGDRHLGVKLTRDSASQGEIEVYFGKGVTEHEQVIFANYIQVHLESKCEGVQRLRHYVCPKCHTPKGNPKVLMEKLLAKKQGATVECDKCEERFSLWDGLEQRFASDEVRSAVEGLQAADAAQLTTRRIGKLLVLEVGARITSANQKWIEIPQDEDDGIDIQLEFTDDEGNGVGKGLCLQLKAGNSHLKKRKGDGAEIFAIKKPRWVETWTNQPYPVMLVVGTFPEDNDLRMRGSERLEFADVRWMEITSVLKQLSDNGTKPVGQIEFKGERLDMSSVHKWRQRMLAVS